ncbi:hypothetical protein KKF61_07400, partial [Patescibacteria group bacterium]|nr:hypothetical protein [Patescibacteria group bacterium]
MNFSAITYIIDPQHEISRADPFRVLVAYSGAAECEPIYVTSYNAAFMEEPLDFSDTFSMSGIVDYPVITRRNITGTVYYHTTGTASATILEHFTGTVFPTMVATGLDRCVFCVFPDWDLLSEYIEATTPIIVITPGIYYSSLSATEILQMHTIA